MGPFYLLQVPLSHYLFIYFSAKGSVSLPECNFLTISVTWQTCSSLEASSEKCNCNPLVTAERVSMNDFSYTELLPEVCGIQYRKHWSLWPTMTISAAESNCHGLSGAKQISGTKCFAIRVGCKAAAKLKHPHKTKFCWYMIKLYSCNYVWKVNCTKQSSFRLDKACFSMKLVKKNVDIKKYRHHNDTTGQKSPPTMWISRQGLIPLWLASPCKFAYVNTHFDVPKYCLAQYFYYQYFSTLIRNKVSSVLLWKQHKASFYCV